jgi:dephospho-CoA kinase
MLELKKVAITGNLNSGKTTVLKLLEEYGAFVLSADQIVQDLLKKPQIIQSIKDLFGKSCIDSNGLIDKARLSEIVFRDEKSLSMLEDLLHPEVLKVIQDEYKAKMKSFGQEKIFAVEVPLLFEAGWQNWFDQIILVIADKEVRQKRYVEQGKTIEQFLERSKRQIDPLVAKKSSQELIENNGSMLDLKMQVQTLIKKLKT